MITLPEGFKEEAIDNDNRSYQYDIKITLADSTVLNIDNEDLVESGGVVIDESVSNDDSLDVGSCIIQKCTLTLRNFNGEFDEYDFRRAIVEVSIWLPIPGETKGFKRGQYIVAELPVYNESSITLTCYDYMCLFDEDLVVDAFSGWGATAAVGMLIVGMLPTGVSLVNLADIPLAATQVPIPTDQTMTCRDLLSYLGQINGGNFRCNENGNLYFQWYSNGFYGTTLRALQDGSVRTEQNGYVRITYPLAGDVVWRNQIEIPALYTLDIERYDTVVTGVRIVINKDDASDAIDSTTYVSGTDDYMISVEDNPLITTTNASAVLACLAASLIGFKYRKASFSHVGMPWLTAGDSARIVDAKGIGHDVIISSTVFTSLDRQTSVSAGDSAVIAVPTRFTPATKSYAKQMQALKPIVADINTRIATASGLYESTEVDTSTGATVYYLHNKPTLIASDIQIMFSDVGIMVTADGGANWYGLTTDGQMLTNLLTVKNSLNEIIFQVSAVDRSVILADEGEQSGDAMFNIFRTADGSDLYAKMYSDTLKLHNGYHATGALDTSLEAGRFLITECNTDSTLFPSRFDHAEYSIQWYRGALSLSRLWVDESDPTQNYGKEIFYADCENEWVRVLGTDVLSKPTFTPATGITVSDQTWSKVGNIVTGDLTFQSNARITSTTTTIGQLNVHPGHSVIGFIRTASIMMRCSIDSSGNIKVNTATNIAANTNIMLTLTFVAA